MMVSRLALSRTVGLAARICRTTQHCTGTSFLSFGTKTTTTTTTPGTLPYRKRDLLTVSILGPPNAGKSTLFNRLLDKKENRAYKLSVDKSKQKRQTAARFGSRGGGGGTAIVSAVPGTTRDRRECIGRIGGTYFRLMDTAGVDGERLDQHRGKGKEHDSEETLVMRAMMQQTAEAALKADLVFLMFDARVGVTNDLLETARWLRRYRLLDNQKNVLVLANKLEGVSWDYEGGPVLDHLAEATRVGFGEAIPISAFHGEGISDIAIAIQEAIAFKRQEEGASYSSDEEEEEGEKPLQLAILGRQNVGKSTMVNALLREERVLVGPTPGLTRDAIAVEWSWNERPVQLVDTAGIRKRSKRDHSSEIEDMAVQDAMRAMKIADVAVLVLDGDARMLQRQELAIADAVLKEGRALVVVANKMDLIVDENANDEDYYSREEFTQAVRDQLEARFPLLRKTPIVAMSSLTGESVEELMPVVFDARDRWARKITTGQLNRWIADVVERNPPPIVSGIPIRIKYVMQTKGRPPTFLLFCNSDAIPETYLRYLTRNFQDTFEMYGMEVRLAAKKSATTNPFGGPRKRSGSGLGGREARKGRMVNQLKSTGSAKHKRRKRSTDNWK
jgi:GTP-binding protein